MNIALKKGRFLLPVKSIAPEQWAVIACDQYTSQPEYWKNAVSAAAGSPSALNLILPEAFLNESQTRIPAIHKTMEDYLSNGIISEAVNGFILTERVTASGVRQGLIVTLDLETYSTAVGADALIRPTEATVPARVPPRAQIRRGAPLETSHVMMLIDDPGRTIIEPLYARRETMRLLYNFDLMLGGGHLAGWAVENVDAQAVIRAMNTLAEHSNGFLYAVGDGNHSLAAAKMCWNEIRATLTEAEREDHPARYAMVELINVNCPAMVFEPIHRIAYNVDTSEMLNSFCAFLRSRGIPDAAGRDVVVFNKDATMTFRIDSYPLPYLQDFLDMYAASHPNCVIDYIHEETALRKLVAEHPNSLGFIPRAFAKNELFSEIRKHGALPCKAFSMGNANEKRYYMETRKLVP